MKNFLKQFGAWATGSKLNLFERARLRLTFYYIGIMAVILITASIALYLALTQELRDDLKDQVPSDDAGQRAFINTLNGSRNTIITGDLIVLVLVAGGSYVLAGKTLHPIRQVLEAEKRFTADASHELRTPLSILKTEAEVALRNPQAEVSDFRNALTSNLEEINRMSGIVENLLTLSNSDYYQDSILQKPLSLRQLLTHVTGKMKPIADQKQITIIVENKDEGTILGDAEALSRVIYNLLNNAITYTRPSGKITAKVVDTGQTVNLTIADTGVGIAPADLPHIFKRFYKADKARTGQGNGAGLGLSIVKSIINGHGGAISVQSKINEGTIIVVSFGKYS